MDDDYALALQLQSEIFEDEYNSKEKEIHQTTAVVGVNGHNEPVSLVDPYWELTDPNPDVRALFLQFNDRFFWGRLAGIEVRWSPRMTLCAGLCCYEGRGGLCSVRLSVPLLKLRPRKDLIETLLHEMIHAYLFVTDNNKDHDGHGPEFHKHMYRINGEAGTSISVYHNFHDEVDALRQHWWRCNGPCQTRKPYFGYVKRSMNRAPSKNDTWWAEHERTCGGSYTKIKEPENYGKKSKKKDGEEKEKVKGKPTVKSMDIRVFGGTGKTLGQPKTANTSDKSRIIAPKTGKTVVPKPSATVTSGVLERTSNDVIAIDNDDDSCDTLPGSKTPSKSQVKWKSNKPVSQGGSATFDKVKRNSVTLPDFSDSDDDEMSRLEEISNREKDNVFGKYNVDMKDGNEGARFDDGSGANEIDYFDDEFDITNIDIPDKSEWSGSTSEIISAGNHLEKSKSTAVDSTDVRAMLRKVWGEKQFNKTNDPGMRGSLSDIGSRSTSVKRSSTDNDSSFHAKKQKTKTTDNYMIHSATGNNKDSRNSKEDNSKTKVTSPIKDLFDKMRAKQDGSKPVRNVFSVSGTVNDISVNDGDRLVGETCGKGANSDNVTVTEETDSVPCPICSKVVPASTVNDHLDLCLTLQAIS